MTNHVTDEERLKRILLVYKYIVDGMSTRECARLLTENGISISNATVKDYIERMSKIDRKKYNEMLAIMNKNKPKSVKDADVKTRVKNVVIALDAGYTFDEIAKQLGESTYTVYRDFRTRLNLLSEDELKDLDITEESIKRIDESLKERSMSNLKRR